MKKAYCSTKRKALISEDVKQCEKMAMADC
jgi:hypothetical protein